MTITVPGMRSNKSVNMDIDQLREWASLMDKAMIASLVTVILAALVLGERITRDHWVGIAIAGAAIACIGAGSA